MQNYYNFLEVTKQVVSLRNVDTFNHSIFETQIKYLAFCILNIKILPNCSPRVKFEVKSESNFVGCDLSYSTSSWYTKFGGSEWSFVFIHT